MDDIFASLQLPYDLKDEQKKVLTALSSGQHAFALLPTGFGKSDCYGLFARLMDKLHPGKLHMTIVVSPLKSLMHDQVQRWNQMGVVSAAVTSDMSKDTAKRVLAGEIQLVFMSPEAALQEPWWGWLRQKRKDICLLALDEVHCLTTWGASFREQYAKVPSLRSIITAPVLMLTATATEGMVDEIIHALHLLKSKVEIVSVLPNRPNIHMQIMKATDDHQAELGWLLKHIRDGGKDATKAIIYCRTITEVTRIYGWLTHQLSTGRQQEPSAETTLVEMFHGKTDADSQARILASFRMPDTNIRCVVATVAFGMGVQVDDIRYIVHWGPSTDILAYWQQVGRCARDGNDGKALMYVYPWSLNKKFIEKDMIDLVHASKAICIRKTILQHLFVKGMSASDLAAVCCLEKGCCGTCDTMSA